MAKVPYKVGESSFIFSFSAFMSQCNQPRDFPSHVASPMATINSFHYNIFVCS